LHDNLEKKIIDDLHIVIDEFNYTDNIENLISTIELENILLGIYKQSNLEDYFDELRYSVPIATDVKSVAAINELRKSIYPKRIQDCTNFLVSKNWGLISATYEYSDEESHADLRKTVFIDSYLCGLLWNYNKKDIINKFLKNKLISDCISILSPTKTFYKNYTNAVHKYAEKYNITEEQTKSLLVEKDIYDDVYIRCGNDDRCILETISEIKKRYIAKISEPLKEKNKILNDTINNKNQQLVDLNEKFSNQSTLIETLTDSLNQKNKKLLNMEDQIYLLNNKNKVLLKYFLQPCFIIEVIILLIGVIGTIFSLWFIPLIILPIIFVKFNRKFGFKDKDEIKQIFIDRIKLGK